MAGDGLGLGEARKNSDSARSRRSYGKTGDYEQSRIEMDFSSFFRILTFSLIEISDLSKQRDS